MEELCHATMFQSLRYEKLYLDPEDYGMIAGKFDIISDIIVRDHGSTLVDNQLLWADLQ